MQTIVFTILGILTGCLLVYKMRPLLASARTQSSDVIQTQQISACNHANRSRLSYYIFFVYQHSAGFGYSSRIVSVSEPLESEKALEEVRNVVMTDHKTRNGEGNCKTLIIQSWQRLPADDQ